ncbi:MAG: hypothetical protein K9J16_01640 [Melioribacteraceae bacterium]|nr:hypothetical protein [Melioribacteraceae bacterium]MCF8352968.1 hypothetical protein [Melioribacteraceae bacterium]MCF8395351.1 hypothetical protein [Melioribacteraceae bacterium]MCF8417847.1 hypothetical protein [Melioribacteraceae bacterium]
MAQQQLLLIALGVIIVGFAVLAGFNYFQEQAVERNRDAVILDLHTLGSQAQTYLKKPVEQGGGGKSFVGFTIPTNLRSNENGSYTLLFARSDRALIQGVGIENSDFNFGCDEITTKITYQITVTERDMTVRKVY